MNQRFQAVRRLAHRFVEGWNAAQGDPQPVDQPVDERFVMKPGEVRIIKGGGARTSRRPDEPRDAS